MYLGGNGFYWKIGRHSEMPHLIEVRRAEGGMRVWASQPGEYYHQLDGEYGGLWRRNGIPPQKFAGVGFTAEGAFEGSYYLRTAASYRDNLAFLFEGISSMIAWATSDCPEAELPASRSIRRRRTWGRPICDGCSLV